MLSRALQSFVISALFLAASASAALALPLPDDPYEPNDSTSTATPIETDGTEYTHYWDDCVEGEYDKPAHGADYFAFPVRKGTLYAATIWCTGYDRWGYAAIVDANDATVSNEERIVGSHPSEQRRILYYAAEADGYMYVGINWMDTIWVRPGPALPYQIKVTEHNRPAVSGIVRDGTSGDPVAGARVRAWQDVYPTAQAAYVDAYTGQDGAYEITFDRPGAVYIRFDDPEGTRLGEWFDSSPAWTDRSPDGSWLVVPVNTALDTTKTANGVVIEPGTLRVHVRDSTGMPASGMTPSVYEPVYVVGEPYSPTYYLSPTDANGATSLPGLDPRKQYLLKVWAPRGTGLNFVEDVPFSVLPGRAVDVTVTLSPIVVVTTSNAKSAYINEPAAISLSATGVYVTHTIWSVDGLEWTRWWGDPLVFSALGRHRLHYRSYDYHGDLEPTKTAEFSVMETTHWPSARVKTSDQRSFASQSTLRSFAPTGPVMPGRTVEVEWSADGRSTWKRFRTVKTDGLGAVNESLSPSKTTYFRFRFSGESDRYTASTSAVMKVVPKPVMSAPRASRVRARTYSLVGTIRPRHAAGSHPVRIYRWRNQSGKWRSYGYVKARASDYSTYSRYRSQIAFSSSGRWRLRAYHPADSQNAAAWSAYSYVSVP